MNAPTLSEAMEVVRQAVMNDPALLPSVLSRFDRDECLKILNRVNLAPFPKDAETVELALWDNDYGRTKARFEARHALQLQVNRVGNTNLKSKRDFTAFADLVEPKKLKRRSRNWGLNEPDKQLLESILSSAESHGALVGRMMLKGRYNGGSHTFQNHYVIVSDIGLAAPRVAIMTPNFKGAFDLDKLTDPAGKDFQTLEKTTGQRSKVIRQCRHSTNQGLQGWTK